MSYSLFFFYICGIVHRGIVQEILLLKRQAVNVNLYIEVKNHLKDRVRRVRSNLRREEILIHHHDDAPTN